MAKINNSKVKVQENVDIGSTLNDQCEPCATPFTDDSMELFLKGIEEMKRGNAGEWQSDYTCTQDQSEISKHLGIDGALSLTYGPASGDAEVSFAMNNLGSDLDVSFALMYAHVGQTTSANVSLQNKLKLKASIAKSISHKKLKEDAFTKKYGKYLIIGVEKGGKLMFLQTIKTQNKEDRSKAMGALSIKLGQAGFDVGGTGSADFKDEKYSSHVELESSKSVFPSYLDKDGIISQILVDLEELANPQTSAVGGDNSKRTDLKGKIDSNVQKYFGRQLDPVYHIVIELRNVSCVDDAFHGGDWDNSNIRPFCDFSNKLYPTLISMQTTMRRYENQISLHSGKKSKDKVLIDKVKTWGENLSTKIERMEGISGDELYETAAEYGELIKSRDQGDSKKNENDDPKKEEKGGSKKLKKKKGNSKKDEKGDSNPKEDGDSNPKEDGDSNPKDPQNGDSTEKEKEMEIKKQFIEININVLKDEFIHDIEKPFEKRVKSLQPKLAQSDESILAQSDESILAQSDESKLAQSDESKLLLEAPLAESDESDESKEKDLLKDEWVDLDELPSWGMCDVMRKYDVKSIDDLMKLSNSQLRKCILNLMDEASKLVVSYSLGFVGKKFQIINSQSYLAIDLVSPAGEERTEFHSFDQTNSTSQQFTMVEGADGFVQIRCEASGMFMIIKSGSKDNGAKLIQYTQLKGPPAKMQFEIRKKKSQDLFMIVNRNSGKAIDVKTGKKGVKIVQSTVDKDFNNPSQLFLLKPVA